jgi:nucleoside-diphosphate-sugar epimerase
MPASQPLVLITGAGGNVGTALAAALRRNYRVVRMDRERDEKPGSISIIAVDLTSAEKDRGGIRGAAPTLRQQHRQRHSSRRLLRLHR